MKNTRQDMPDREANLTKGKRDNPDALYSEFEKRLGEKLADPIRMAFTEAPPGLREKILSSIADIDADQAPGESLNNAVLRPLFRNGFAIAAVLTLAAVVAAVLLFDSSGKSPVVVASIPELSENLPGALDTLVSGPYEEELGRLARDVAAAESQIWRVLTVHMPVRAGDLPFSTDGLNPRSIMRLPSGFLPPEGQNGS
jgi:hypothetical protein